LDPAESDLPLDFNALFTPDLRLDPLKLARALMRSPAVVPRLVKFQKESRAAAQKLAEVLWRVLAAGA
jgi:hypothetical protein